MGGILTIREGVTWHTQYGNFIEGMRLIERVIRTRTPHLADERMIADDDLDYEMPHTYTHLNELGGQDFINIVGGVSSGIEQILDSGPQVWPHPEHWAYLMFDLSDLKMELRSDPRMQHDAGFHCCVIVSPTAKLTMPAWAYDRVLEQVAVRMMGGADPRTVDHILLSRTNMGELRLDISQWDRSDFGDFHAAVIRMRLIRGRRSDVPREGELYEAVFHLYKRLDDLLSTDRRDEMW